MIVKVMYSATPEIKALILDYNIIFTNHDDYLSSLDMTNLKNVCRYMCVCVYLSNIAVDNQQGSYFLALISLLIKRIDATKP